MTIIASVTTLEKKKIVLCQSFYTQWFGQPFVGNEAITGRAVLEDYLIENKKVFFAIAYLILIWFNSFLAGGLGFCLFCEVYVAPFSQRNCVGLVFRSKKAI